MTKFYRKIRQEILHRPAGYATVMPERWHGAAADFREPIMVDVKLQFQRGNAVYVIVTADADRKQTIKAEFSNYSSLAFSIGRAVDCLGSCGENAIVCVFSCKRDDVHCSFGGNMGQCCGHTIFAPLRFQDLPYGVAVCIKDAVERLLRNAEQTADERKPATSAS